MNERDHKKLCERDGHFYRGGLPDLGKPHRKSGYRWSVGYAKLGDGAVRRWRENLGHDLLVAQYRAREMTDLWAVHVDDHHQTAIFEAGKYVPIDEVAIPPLDREQARKEAWAAAEEALREPRRLAERANAALQRADDGRLGPALSPGMKLVAVPTTVPDSKAKQVAHEPVPLTPVVRADQPLSLHAAADRWLDHLKRRLARGDASDDYVDRIETSTLPRIKELAEDYPLERLGKPELGEVRVAFQSKRKRDGKLRERSTIRTELRHVRTLLGWLDDAELWPNPPRQWQKCLRPVFRSDEQDDDADAPKRHDTYTRTELAKLYAAAGPSVRLWMLCVLNFAWGQKEIATVRKAHFKTARPERRRVGRYRHKRTPGSEPVPGRWTAWPETWEAAVARMAKTTDDPSVNPKGLAFLTAQDQPLVRRKIARRSGKARRYDAIAEAFAETCRKADVRNRGFYLLRHTGINMIKRIGGSEVADLYCQHAPDGMTAEHYVNADWAALRRALRKLRGKLQPMFDAAAKAGAELAGSVS